jgi:hypothetical protein
MADLDETIAEIDRGRRGKLRIRRCTFKGSDPYLDVRHFWPDEDADGELKPGKGVTVKMTELSAVIAALTAVDVAARKAKQDERRPRAQQGQRTLADVADERQAREDMEAF